MPDRDPARLTVPLSEAEIDELDDFLMSDAVSDETMRAPAAAARSSRSAVALRRYYTDEVTYGVVDAEFGQKEHESAIAADLPTYAKTRRRPTCRGNAGWIYTSHVYLGIYA